MWACRQKGSLPFCFGVKCVCLWCRLLWNAPCRVIIVGPTLLYHSISSNKADNDNRAWCDPSNGDLFVSAGLMKCPCVYTLALLYLFSASIILIARLFHICLWPRWAVYSGKQDWQRIKVGTRSCAIVSAVYLDSRSQVAVGSARLARKMFQKIHLYTQKDLRPAETPRWKIYTCQSVVVYSRHSRAGQYWLKFISW